MRGRLWVMIIVALAVLMVSSVLLYEAKEGVEVFPNRTTYSARPGGYKALYLTMQEIGYPSAGRWRKSLADFTRPEDSMVITSLQLGQSISSRERDVLQEWVQDGGRLVLLGHWFPVEEDLSSLLEVFDLRVEADEAETEFPFGELSMPAREIPAVQPTAYVSGVEKVAVGSSLRLATPRANHVAHLADEKGDVCISMAYGRGKVIALADAGVGANQWIDRADNLRFLLNVLTQEMGAGTVWFDEYHHGFRDTEGFAAAAGRTRAAPVVLQLGLVAVIWLLASARRFGPLRPLPLRTRKETAEHVDCLANLYETAQAQSYALGEIYQKFKTDAARVSGLPPSAEFGQVAVTYAHKFGYNADELKRIMLRCEQDATWKRLSSRELFRLVRSLEQFVPRRRGTASVQHEISYSQYEEGGL